MSTETKTPPSRDARYLRIEEFAVAIRKSRGTVYRLLKDGEITARVPGKGALIEQTPQEYLDACPRWQPGAMPPQLRRSRDL